MENPATTTGNIVTTNSSASASKRRGELEPKELMVVQKQLKNEGEGNIIPVASSHEVSSTVTSTNGGQSRRSVEIEEPLSKLCLANAVCWAAATAAVLVALVILCYRWARNDESYANASVMIVLLVYMSFFGLAIGNYCYGAFVTSGSESDKLRASDRLHDSLLLRIVIFYLTPRFLLARRLMFLLSQEKHKRQQEERERQQQEEREKRRQQQQQQLHPIPIHNIPTTHSHAISIYSDY